MESLIFILFSIGLALLILVGSLLIGVVTGWITDEDEEFMFFFSYIIMWGLSTMSIIKLIINAGYLL